MRHTSLLRQKRCMIIPCESSSFQLGINMFTLRPNASVFVVLTAEQEFNTSQTSYSVATGENIRRMISKNLFFAYAMEMFIYNFQKYSSDSLNRFSQRIPHPNMQLFSVVISILCAFGGLAAASPTKPTDFAQSLSQFSLDLYTVRSDTGSIIRFKPI